MTNLVYHGRAVVIKTAQSIQGCTSLPNGDYECGILKTSTGSLIRKMCNLLLTGFNGKIVREQLLKAQVTQAGPGCGKSYNLIREIEDNDLVIVKMRAVK